MSAEIDILEAPLREAHAKVGEDSVTFQSFVRRIIVDPRHPLHANAVDYNRAVYVMQAKWRM